MQKFVTKIGKGPFADEVQPILNTWWETGAGVQVRVQVEEKGQELGWCTQQRRKTPGLPPPMPSNFGVTSEGPERAGVPFLLPMEASSELE